MDGSARPAGAPPLGWPVLANLPRRLLLLFRVAASISAVGAVLTAANATPSDLTVGRWALAALGLLVTLASIVSTWAVLGRMPTTVRSGVQGRGTWREQRKLRRDLLRGHLVEGDRRRLAAVEVAYWAVLPMLVTVMGVIVGPLMVQRGVDTSGPAFAQSAFTVLTAVPAVILLVMFSTMLQWLRVRRAAAAIGVLPTVEPDTRARSSDGAAAG